MEPQGARGRGPPSPVPRAHTGGRHAGGWAGRKRPLSLPGRAPAAQGGGEGLAWWPLCPRLPGQAGITRGSWPRGHEDVLDGAPTSVLRRREKAHEAAVRQSHGLGSRRGSGAGLPASVRDSTENEGALSPLDTAARGPAGDGLTLSAPGDTGPGGRQEAGARPRGPAASSDGPEGGPGLGAEHTGGLEVPASPGTRTPAGSPPVRSGLAAAEVPLC